jgi:hypothetical protein
VAEEMGWNAVHRAGKPRGKRYRESFNGKLRDEFLRGEILCSLNEAQIVIEKWRIEYNTKRRRSEPQGTKTNFTANRCDVDSLIGHGTKTRAGQFVLPIPRPTDTFAG